MSGWTNPLAWSDDGTGDDEILNMHFDMDMKKDDDDLKYGDNVLDDDIQSTLINEKNSEALVRE